MAEKEKKSNHNPNIDWKKIKTEYITSKDNSVTQETLCKKYDVSARQMAEHCSKEKWVEKRKAYRKSVAEKTLEKISNKESSKLASLMASTDKLVKVVADTLEDPDQFKRYIVTDGLCDGRSETTEKIFEKVDIKAIKDLTTILKDLVALNRNLYNIPTEAELTQREIAKQRLEIEKTKSEAITNPDRTIQVVFGNTDINADEEGWCD